MYVQCTRTRTNLLFTRTIFILVYWEIPLIKLFKFDLIVIFVQLIINVSSCFVCQLHTKSLSLRYKLLYDRYLQQN